MSIIQSVALLGASGQGPSADLGDTIDQSLRFRGAQNLKRTLGTPTNQNNWTVSLWFKNAKLGSRGDFFDASNVNPPSDSNLFEMFFNGDGTLAVGKMSASNSSTAKFRDPAAWYHIVITNDGTDIEVYVNGDLVNTWSGQGGSTGINTAAEHCIGCENFHNGDGLFTEGYMAEFNFLDGTHLTPTSFGRTNNDGVWVPKDLSGLTSDQYGNNGFRLQFQDADNLGDDTAPTGGNHNTANDFTASGFDTAAISSSNEDNDIDYEDTPTNNHATLNPLLAKSASLNFEHAYLRAQYGSSGSQFGMAGFGMPGSSGKYYWEVTLKEQKEGGIGIVSEDFDLENGNDAFGMDSSGAGWEWIVSEGRRDNNGETPNSHTIPNVGDTIGFLLDTDAGTCTIEINGVAQTANNGAKFTNIPTDKTIFPYFRLGGASGDANLDWNFGQMPFQHEPSGYQHVATNSLPEPAIKNGEDHFVAVLDTGANIRSTAEATFTNGAFLIRTRADDSNDAQDNQWQWLDTVRGGNTAITFPFNTSGTAGNFMTTYDAPESNSFAYCWNAGAPATNGFQIIEDSSPTTGNNVISHNLGKTPEFIFSKETNNSDLGNIYHTSIGTSGGLTTAGAVEHTNAFRVTAVSGSSFTIADSDSSNAQIHYVWTSIKGFSKFGEYNAATAFVYTGFKPALLWIKKTGVAESWYVTDGKRNPNNPVQIYTVLNAQGVETTSSGDRDVDFVSNGFKIRGTDSQISGSAQYVYMCWAEHPFGGENAPPATAR